MDCIWVVLQYCFRILDIACNNILVVVALYCHLSQVPAKLAINLSIHTQHTYDNGVDRTGRQGMEEKYSITWGEGEEKKKINPQTMLHLGSTVWEQKKTPQHKSTYTINTQLCNRGKHIQLWQAAIRSGAIYFGAGHRPAWTAWRYKAAGGSWSGEGSNVCNRGGSKRVPLQRSSQGSYPARPWPVPVRGSQKQVPQNPDFSLRRWCQLHWETSWSNP